MSDKVVCVVSMYVVGVACVAGACLILGCNTKRNVLRDSLYSVAWPILLFILLFQAIYRVVYKYIDTRFWNDLHELIPSIAPDTLPVRASVQDGYIVIDDRPLEDRYVPGQWTKDSESAVRLERATK